MTTRFTYVAGVGLARQSERFALMREGQQVLQSIMLANTGPIPSTELQELAERQLTTLMRQVELYAQQLYTESRFAVRAIYEKRTKFVRSFFTKLGFRGLDAEIRTRSILCYLSWEPNMYSDETQARQLRLLKLHHELLTAR